MEHSRLRNLAIGGLACLIYACGDGSSASGGGVGSAPILAPPTVVAVETVPKNAALPLGYPLQINLIATLSDGTHVQSAALATWSSSNTTVTGVNGGLVQAAAPGTTTVAATLQNQTATTNVTVTQATLTGLQIAPINAQTLVGQAVSYAAAAIFSDSTVLNVTNVAIWSSSNTTVSSVSVTGVATSSSPGSTVIGANLNTQSASGNLTVLAGTAPTGGGIQGGFQGGGLGGFQGGGLQGGGLGGFQGGFQAGGIQGGGLGGFQGGFQGGGLGGFQGGFQAGGLNFN